MDKTIVALVVIAVVIIAAILIIPSGRTKATPKVTVQSTIPVNPSGNSVPITTTSITSTTVNVTSTTEVRRGHPQSNTTVATTTINSTAGGPPGVLVVSVVPNSTIADVGEPLILRAVANGGQPNYTYQWYLNSQQLTGADNATLNVTSQSTGTFQYYVSVTDATNKTVNSGFVNLLVNGALQQDQFSVSVGNVSGSGGSATVAATGSVGGGVPPYSYCVYQEYPSSSEYASLGYVNMYCLGTNSTVQTLYLSPHPVFGTYYYYLNVTDAAGATVSTDGSPIPITYVNTT